MTDKAVFSGSYSDIRFVRTRKIAAITIEIPIEAASAFIEAFGAPDPSKECPVAIARLFPASSNGPATDFESVNGGSTPSAGTKDKKRWDDLPPSQQAAIRCNEKGFIRWLDVIDERDAACVVRERCGVLSRAELDKEPTAAARWRQIDDAYITHSRGYEALIR